MHSASLGNPLKQLWSAYERQLERRPLLTQMTTSAVLWGAGDAIAQRLERLEQQRQQQQRRQAQAAQQCRPGKAAAPPPPQQQHGADDAGVDWRRALLTAMFGAAFVGPVGHTWYQALDSWCRRLVPQGGPAFIASKVAIDTVVLGPFYVAAFFAWGCALIDRSGVQDFKRKMAVDFWPTLAAEVSVWPLVQAVNFSVVPVKHQLLVINVFTIMDAAFMSWARGQEDWVAKVTAALQRRQPGGGSGGAGRQLQMQPLVAAQGVGVGGKGGAA